MSSILAHITVGVSDFEKSREFYEELLATLGYKPGFSIKNLIGFGAENHEENFWVNGHAKPSFGLHICFTAHSKNEVKNFHETGLKLGAKDNGAPGFRKYTNGYYAAYLIDSDEYRLEALYRQAP